jgi:hypothetical protein
MCRLAATTSCNPVQDDATHDSPFAIGWDHAHYRVTPPLERLCINPRLRHGFQAGRSAFGGRTLAAPVPVREWLALRLDALAAGCAFESVRLTPGYLARLAVAHCPVTREPLAMSAEAANGWRVARVRRDAGYAAGNLARLGVRADAAQTHLAQTETLDLLHSGEAGANDRHAGLTLAQARRLAVLRSFVRPLSHAAAAALPLLVLPPPGLLLFNPLQALQCRITRCFGEATPNQRLAALREALPDGASRAAFDSFVAAYHPAFAAAAAQPAPAPRWALEDAWADGRVLDDWKRLARTLSAVQCESLLLRHAPQGLLVRPDALATEGWALESAGRVGPPRRLASRLPAVCAAPQRPAQPNRAGGARALPLPAGATAGSPRQHNLFIH